MDLPEGVNEVDLDQWDSRKEEEEEMNDILPSDIGNEGKNEDSFDPINISSSSEDINEESQEMNVTQDEIPLPNIPSDQDNNNINNTNNIMEEDDDSSVLSQHFQDFIQEKQQITITIKEEDVNYLPPPLRPSVRTLITKLKRWLVRNPSPEVLEQIQILSYLLNQFLELQHHRSNRNYDIECTELLKQILQKNIEAQRLARRLRTASEPRSLDEISC